jgi:asparagine synthase (glutamine-hydrolysing)
MIALIAFKYTVGDYNGRKLAERCVEIMTRDGAWTMAVNYRGLRLLTRTDARDVDAIVLPSDKGVVSGILFERREGGDRRLYEVDGDAVSAWCASEGKALVEQYWGPYLAVVSDTERDRVLILRDPLVARACYFAELPGVHVMFTDVADWAQLSSLTVDDDYITLFLRHTRIEGARTGLCGVREAIPGVLYRWERSGPAETTVWAPWPPARGAAIFNFDEARAGLRRSAEAAAGAWAHADLPIVHRLSGGFDSSAALACLVRCGASDIVCVNERPLNVPEGDEFDAASRMAAHVGVKLCGLTFDAATADYGAIQRAPASAKPSPADMAFASAEITSLFDEGRLSALTSGQGGDQVFSRRPLTDAAADAIRDGRSWAEVRRILWEEARLSGKPLAEILSRSWLGLVQPQGRRVTELLNTHRDAKDGEQSAALAYQLAHPWLCDIDHRGPARTYRALNLLDLAFYQRPTPASAHSLAAPSFASQPIVETILRIPPYVMQQGGMIRALARAVFADLLPPATLGRTRKGDTTRHFRRALDKNLDFLRAFLPDGELVRRGILDRCVLEDDLKAPEGRALFRLSAALVAESWIARIKALPAPLEELV